MFTFNRTVTIKHPVNVVVPWTVKSLVRSEKLDQRADGCYTVVTVGGICTTLHKTVCMRHRRIAAFKQMAA